MRSKENLNSFKHSKRLRKYYEYNLKLQIRIK